MESLVLDIINNIIGRNIVLVHLVFFISSFLQMVFPPHPGDFILVFQGYLTGISSSFSVVFIILNSAAATFAGSYIIYKLGYGKGDRVFEYKLAKRFISCRHRMKARNFIEKYGVFAIFASKFIPGINAVTILFAGIFKLKRSTAYPAIIASIIIHHILHVMLGRFLGNNMNHVKKIITTYNGIVLAFLAAAAVTYILYQYITARAVKHEKA